MKTIQLPQLRKGATNATIRRWIHPEGTEIAQGMAFVDLETEDSLVRLTAEEAGVLQKVVAPQGVTVTVGGALAEFEVGASGNQPLGPLGNEQPPADDGAGQEPTAPAASKAPDAKAIPQDPKPASQGSAAASVDLSAFTPIIMPQAGNSMEEGTILAWHVKPGDTIETGQIICEIETDKATMEYEAPEAGRLAGIVAQEGDIVPVKEPIAYLGEGELPDTINLQGDSSKTPESSGSDASSDSSEKVELSASERADLESRITPILMPQAGNSMEEGSVLSWSVAEGDSVEEGQILCEIETDKATMEYESPAAGRLARIVAQPDQVIPVKQPIAVLADQNEDADRWLSAQGGAAKADAEPAESAPTASPATTKAPAATASVPKARKPVNGGRAPSPAVARGDTPMTASGRIMASPAARKLAAERQIDLAGVGPGSGPRGRILFEDIAALPAGGVAKAGASAAAQPAIEPLKTGVGDAAEQGQVVRHAITKMRKAIATNLQRSKQSVPHFYVRMSIDAQPLFKLYREQKPLTGCTLNDVILLGVGQVMAEFPAVRSQMIDNEIVEYPTANVGVAVGVPDGLVVPVVEAVDRLSLAEIAQSTKRVVERARNGQIENMGKGNFTISNLGMFGVDDFSAIINPPESGILAISAVKDDVIVRDGMMKIGKKMCLTLSADHRVVDGLLAAQFMKRLTDVLENPAVLMV